MSTLEHPQEIINRVRNAMLCMQRASWEQGTAAQALLELHDAFPEEQELQWLICLAHDTIVRQDGDGRLGVRLNRGDPGATDAISPVPALLRAYKETGDDVFLSAAKKAIEFITERAPKTKDGIVSHRTDGVTLWVDALYMAPPSLAEAGVAWNDQALLDEAVKQIKGYVAGLWDKEKHLFSHIYNVDAEKFGRHAFWGVGNGWAVSGMVRVYALLPSTMVKEKEYILAVTLETVSALLSHLRSDSLLHDVVDDPATFVDTNCPQQLAYTIFRLAKLGILPPNKRDEWLRHAAAMRNAAHGKVDKYGFVRDVCGSPTFDKAGVATEGQAFFLLMEAAYQQLGIGSN
ncbi:glycoside hydrolase family 105 protein [Calocera viscosa TUFC12733]|uniref:Glycoside hydrolase family 105 protein n=1 Tax=Calocera viscosa (strain TUFC12733) TaxID=1330018 RepID=A0A167LFX6_CALVF|nr:glycoside hydrolase family 105 protein [Calocera viscosa TUFC12733]